MMKCSTRGDRYLRPTPTRLGITLLLSPCHLFFCCSGRCHWRTGAANQLVWLLGTWRTLLPLGWLFCWCLLVFDFLLVAALVRGDHHSPMSFAWSARGFPFGSLHQHHEDGCMLRKAHCWVCLAALTAATLEPSLAENWSWWAFPWKFTPSWQVCFTTNSFVKFVFDFVCLEW